MSATDPHCPGCGLPDQPVNECERCEFHNLETGRYHYCGDPGCYCRDLPGLGDMRPELKAHYIARHQAWVALGDPNALMPQLPEGSGTRG